MGCYGCCVSYEEQPRRFLTKEERIQMLKEYKEHLEKETKGVAEKISDLRGE